MLKLTMNICVQKDVDFTELMLRINASENNVIERILEEKEGSFKIDLLLNIDDNEVLFHERIIKFSENVDFNLVEKEIKKIFKLFTVEAFNKLLK